MNNPLFVNTTGYTGYGHSFQLEAALAPTILGGPDKSGSKTPIAGRGEFAYEAEHDWGAVPSHIRYGNTHGVVEDAQGRITLRRVANPRESRAWRCYDRLAKRKPCYH